MFVLQAPSATYLSNLVSEVTSLRVRHKEECHNTNATGWTVLGSNPGGARFSAPVQTGSGAHPASCTRGTGSFLGVKQPGRGADHPPPSKCQGHEGVGLYLYSPSGPQWPVIGKTFTFTFTSQYKTSNLDKEVRNFIYFICSKGYERDNDKKKPKTSSAVLLNLHSTHQQNFHTERHQCKGYILEKSFKQCHYDARSYHVMEKWG